MPPAQKVDANASVIRDAFDILKFLKINEWQFFCFSPKKVAKKGSKQ